MPNHYSTFAREMARMEADRASWRQALAQTDAIARQMRELSLGISASAQLAKAMKSLQSPAMTFGQQYQDLLSTNSSAMQSIKAWQEAEHVQNEQMRRMLDPLDGIRKSLLADDTTQKLIKELTAAREGLHNLRRSAS